MIQLVDFMATADLDGAGDPVYTTVNLPTADWCALVPDSQENACVIAMRQLADQRKTHLMTPHRPVLLDGPSAGPRGTKSIEVRLPYGPNTLGTLMCGLYSDTWPMPRSWSQRFVVRNFACPAGNPADFNTKDVFAGGGGAVACTGMRSGVLAVQQVGGTTEPTWVSVFAGTECVLGARDFRSRVDLSPLSLVVGGLYSVQNRGKVIRFEIPPGVDWLKVRAWRFSDGSACVVDAKLVLSSEMLNDRNDPFDSSNFALSAAAHTLRPIIGCSNGRTSAIHGVGRVSTYNGGPDTLTFNAYLYSNIGTRDSLDRQGIVTSAVSGAVAPGGVAIVATPGAAGTCCVGLTSAAAALGATGFMSCTIV